MLHDYWCPSCKFRLDDQVRTAAQGGRNTAPECPHCHYPMIWIVPVPRMDLRTDGGGAGTFQKFTMRDGKNDLVEIDSLHKLRQVEAESEKLAANGEGQQIRVRGFSQDRSNMGQNTFGDQPTEHPTDEAKRKFGLRGGFKPLSEEQADGSAYGPGVDESNTSALTVD